MQRNTDTAYSFKGGGLVEHKTCRRDFINDKSLLIIDCLVCWIKFLNSVYCMAYELN